MKLVRDGYSSRIPPEALSKAEGNDILAGLDRKLDEECGELRQSGFTDAEEFGDVLEVLMELAARGGVDWASVEAERARKAEKLGGFKTGLMYDPEKDPTPR